MKIKNLFLFLAISLFIFWGLVSSAEVREWRTGDLRCYNPHDDIESCSFEGPNVDLANYQLFSAYQNTRMLGRNNETHSYNIGLCLMDGGSPVSCPSGPRSGSFDGQMTIDRSQDHGLGSDTSTFASWVRVRPDITNDIESYTVIYAYGRRVEVDSMNASSTQVALGQSFNINYEISQAYGGAVMSWSGALGNGSQSVDNCGGLEDCSRTFGPINCSTAGTTQYRLTASGPPRSGGSLRSEYRTVDVSCVSSSTSVCGNNIQEPGEQCDTGVNNGACPRTCSSTSSNPSNPCTWNSCGGGAPPPTPPPPPPTTYTLTVTAAGSGRIRAEYQDSSGNWIYYGECRANTCQAVGPAGIGMRLTAIPDTGNTFNGWGGVCTPPVGNNATGICLGNLNGNYTVTGSFSAVPSYPPGMSLDSPFEGEIVSGVRAIGGWAMDNPTQSESAIVELDMWLDGVLISNNSYGNTDRSDACNAFMPWRPGCPMVGFSYGFDSTLYANGPHRIDVRVEDANGQVTNLTRNFTISNVTPPTMGSVIISSLGVRADAVGGVGGTQYTITHTSSDNQGGGDIIQAYALINYQGDNIGQHRGWLTWGAVNLWPTSKDVTACSGGGFAAIQDPANGNGIFGYQYIELDSCSTIVSGTTRTVNFVVRFNSLFSSVGPVANNDISGFVYDSTGAFDPRSWVNYDINFGLIPPPPSNLSLSCGGSGTTVTASWTAPSGWNTFYVRANPGANNATWPSQIIQDSVVGTSTTFPSSPGQTYYVWMHTRNPVTGAWSTELVANNVTCATPPPPPLPTGLSFNCATDTLTWNSSSGAEGYSIGVNYVPNDPVPPATCAGSVWYCPPSSNVGEYWAPGNGPATSFSAPNNQEGQPYLASVLAYNSSGNSGWATLNFTCAAPPAIPINLSHTCNVAGDQVTVSWDPVSGATGYHLWIDDWSTGTAPDYSILNYTGGTQYTQSVTPNQGYGWWLQSYNGSGASGTSEAASFTCSPSQPDYSVNGIGTAGPVPGPIAFGQSVSFFGTVNNIGSANASSSSNTRLRLDIDNNGGPLPGGYDLDLGLRSTAGLAAGASEVENWNDVWTATVGTHEFEICADSGSVVGESNETNNCTIGTFTVSAAPLTCSQPTTAVPPNTSVTFTATGGTGAYSWSTSPAGSPASAPSGSSFATQWANTGNKTVTVTSGSATATCNVTVFDVDLFVDQATITIGTGPQQPTLGWTSHSSAVSCVPSSDHGDWTGGPFTYFGTANVGPYTVPDTYTYTITCTSGPGGWTDSDSVSVVVSAPTPSISNGTVTVNNSNYCAVGPHAQVNWVYTPIGNPPQSNQVAYEVVINGGADLNVVASSSGVGFNPDVFGMNPEWFVSGAGTSAFAGPSSGCNSTNSDANPQLPCQLGWNTNYTAWVRVQNGYGVWSPWTRMTSYTNGTNPPVNQNFWRTPEHALPDPDFVVFPMNPALNTPVTVTEVLPTFDALSDYASRSWYFGDGTARVYQYDGTLPFNIASASHTYSNFGSFDITLRAQDESGVCESTQTVNVQQALPRWREIAPR